MRLLDVINTTALDSGRPPNISAGVQRLSFPSLPFRFRFVPVDFPFIFTLYIAYPSLSINSRDAASTACDCRAGVLGDQAVTAVGQDPGLTAGNPSHGELTAVDQSPDDMRRDAQTPRGPGLRNPRTSSLAHHEPHTRTVIYYQDTRCSRGSFPERNLAVPFPAWASFQQVYQLFMNIN